MPRPRDFLALSKRLRHALQIQLVERAHHHCTARCATEQQQSVATTKLNSSGSSTARLTGEGVISTQQEGWQGGVEVGARAASTELAPTVTECPARDVAARGVAGRLPLSTNTTTARTTESVRLSLPEDPTPITRTPFSQQQAAAAADEGAIEGRRLVAAAEPRKEGTAPSCLLVSTACRRKEKYARAAAGCPPGMSLYLERGNKAHAWFLFACERHLLRRPPGGSRKQHRLRPERGNAAD
ncbi:hypothetical protein HPB50_010499 [Hyalomma asiaticum]|uniref:Uncharacterized protein n=1 Tax=Hyalomma asiaticum TaxID=266040 RepID=A0ACB7SFQ3_HYAAI|nr:hypothetical protein HPB50_010499 [Hyalomma asiaticum]